MGRPRTSKLSKAEQKTLDKEQKKLLKMVLDYVEKSPTIGKMLRAQPKSKRRRSAKKAPEQA
jgi:hypothetical protein